MRTKWEVGLYRLPLDVNHAPRGAVSSVCLPQRSAGTDAFSFGCSAFITNQWQLSRNKQYELIPFEMAKSTPPAAVVPQTMSSLLLDCPLMGNNRSRSARVSSRPTSSRMYSGPDECVSIDEFERIGIYQWQSGPDGDLTSLGSYLPGMTEPIALWA